uniref:Neuromedin U n=1 Tax=Cynoglossus semilaevis TaxID=244447 RepID=A0A3P8UZD9_CYNSE
MRTFKNQSHPVHRGASSNLHNLSTATVMSPVSTGSITLAALLILAISVCKSECSSRTSANHNRPGAATQPGIYRILSLVRSFFVSLTLCYDTLQIEVVCSSYLSADLKYWPSDFLGELCVMMLVQKSKELKVQEKSKRAELQGPAGIQSRGYFLYRPRNGRRSIEYK